METLLVWSIIAAVVIVVGFPLWYMIFYVMWEIHKMCGIWRMAAFVWKCGFIGAMVRALWAALTEREERTC